MPEALAVGIFVEFSAALALAEADDVQKSQ